MKKLNFPASMAQMKKKLKFYFLRIFSTNSGLGAYMALLVLGTADIFLNLINSLDPGFRKIDN